MPDGRAEDSRLSKRTLKWTIIGTVVAIVIAGVGYIYGAVLSQSGKVDVCREALIEYLGSVDYEAAITQDPATLPAETVRSVADLHKNYNIVLIKCPIRFEPNGYILEGQRSEFYNARDNFECATKIRPLEKCSNSNTSIPDANRDFQAIIAKVIRIAEDRQRASTIDKVRYVFEQDV